MQFRSWISMVILAFAGPAAAESDPGNKEPIIVTGDRAEEAEMTADLAKTITWRPPIDKPLPKHYEPVCIKVFGLDPEYSDVLAERMRDNMRALNLVLAGTGCSPNIWVGFVKDSQAAVQKLRKNDSAMFGDLADYEIDRILAGSKASQAWFAREDKSIDGKAFKYRTIEISGVEVSVKHNDPWRASRITGTIRVNMNGSIVLFDRVLSAGKSIRQLADYATFRALAPVSDIADQTDTPLSILSLFADGGQPAAGLTEFDWAYLAGYYMLGEHANASAVHDAAKTAFLKGAGQKAAEKSGFSGDE